MSKPMLLVSLGVMMTLAVAHGALPVEIAPTDPKIYYTGRFDFRDPAGPRCQWSGCMASLRFRGSDLKAAVHESGDDYLEVVVDGKDHRVVKLQKGASEIDLAKGLSAGEHVVQVMKRTEPLVGVLQFRKFYLGSGGELLEPRRWSRKIEVIGDSISCGYGDEAASEKEQFTPATENAWKTYGAITARAFGAEYVCLAWSGRKLWPDNTIPAIYELTLPGDPESVWNFSTQPPDVVLINLATNDFGPQNPDEVKWTEAYKRFIRLIRKRYPSAMIYMASGSMMSDYWPPERKVLTTLKKYLQRIEDEMKTEGETRLRQIHFGFQNGQADGLGADWHPNAKTQQKMANVWIAELQKTLDWKPIAK